jgi:hypothetical protein
MKTLDEIKEHIELIEQTIRNDKIIAPKNKCAKGFRDLKQAKTAIQYLKHSPNEVFIKSEIQRLNTFISSKELQFDSWLHNNQINVEDEKDRSKKLTIFRKEFEIDRKNKQLKMLNYLIK